ncbi:MAG: portal protein, partial [bacterium]|nr:portal protein [bacterium]
LWIRDLIKYGDYFVHLHVHKDEGVYDFMTLPQEEIHREEGFDGTASSVRFRWETTQDYFESWQIAHFRLIEDTRKLPYGRSMLDPARKLWKQLQLAEDSMLVYRITRAPERRIFYIEVGNLEDADVKQYMQRIQRQVKKQPVVNQNNGNMSFRYDPMNVSEDYFIPVRGDKSTKIDTLPGASNLGDIQDIEYLENKLFAALKVPKTYLNYAENLPGGPTLSQADLRFARTINRIQEQVLMELRRIAKIHLAFLGHEDEINDFDLKLTNPSTQQELLKLETMKSRLEVFALFVSQDLYSPASYTWGMKYILGFSEKDIKKMLRQKKVERKLFTEIEFAPQTYKKIGLFKDLDDKFEIPGAAEALQNAENEDLFDGGGEGAGGFGGGGGGDSLAGDPTGDLNLGGDGADAGDFGGGAAVGAPAGDATDPLSERTRKRIWEGHNNRVDDAIDDLLKELEETSEDVFVEEEDKEENALFKSNEALSSQTDKMIGEIKQQLGSQEKDIENYVVPKGVILQTH